MNQTKQYTIAIGADHRGYELKSYLLAQSNFGESHVTWLDMGTYSTERTDYPLFAAKVVEAIKTQKADLGIFLCGSGIGAAIAANRTPGIYAGVVWNPEIATAAKEDDNITILVLPADYITRETAVHSINAWLCASFKGGRYQERLSMIDK